MDKNKERHFPYLGGGAQGSTLKQGPEYKLDSEGLVAGPLITGSSRAQSEGVMWFCSLVRGQAGP